MEHRIAPKLRSFFSHYTQVTYVPGKLLIAAHEKPQGIFFVEKGMVRQYAVSKDGNEMTLNVYKPDTFFPMSYALNGSFNQHNFEATSETCVRIAPSEEVVTFLKKEPEVLLDLVQRVFAGLDGFFSRVEQLMSGKAQARLVIILLIMAKRFGKSQVDHVRLSQKLTHQDLAAFTGLSRETVSREMIHLKRLKLLDYKSNLVRIFDLTKLEQLTK